MQGHPKDKIGYQRNTLRVFTSRLCNSNLVFDLDQMKMLIWKIKYV